MKECASCKITKECGEFYNDKSRKDGKFSWCKLCVKQRQTYRKDLRTTEHNRARYFKSKYGISVVEYDQMVMAQCGLCAVCSLPDTEARKNGEMRLVVHHDHATGNVVALLCSKCNRGMGSLNDDPVLLRRAADLMEEKARAN